MIFNKLKNLIIIGAGCHWKVVKEREYFCPIFEISACELTNYEWMTSYMAII